MAYKATIAKDITPILWAKARKEQKKVDDLINCLLRQALWNEPEVLFKGRSYKVEPDLFGENKPPVDM